MKRFLIPLILLSIGLPAFSEIPRKMPYTKYRSLWDDSPFTTKPIIESAPVEENVFEDYALAGVAPIKGGYQVTLIDRKDPGKRTYINSDDERPPHGFKIESVERDNDDFKGTVVHLRSGSRRGTVSYDEKLLTLVKPPAPKATSRQQTSSKGRPKTMPGQVPGMKNGKSTGKTNRVSPRAPRSRVIGPPVNQQQNQQNKRANPLGVGTRPTVRSR